MKVHVVYDEAGRIQAISHPIPGKNGAPTLGRFRPHPGQRIATLTRA